MPPTTRRCNAFTELARLEGIIPALESAHAVAEVIRRAPGLARDQIIIINLSGRGDKDVAQAADAILRRKEAGPPQAARCRR